MSGIEACETTVSQRVRWKCLLPRQVTGSVPESVQMLDEYMWRVKFTHTQAQHFHQATQRLGSEPADSLIESPGTSRVDAVFEPIILCAVTAPFVGRSRHPFNVWAKSNLCSDGLHGWQNILRSYGSKVRSADEATRFHPREFEVGERGLASNYVTPTTSF